MIALRKRTLALAMVALSAGIGGAHSADLSMRPLAPAVDFSGWYLRGDIGFSNQPIGSLFNENYSRFDSVTNIDKVTNSMMVELAYRYIDLSKATTGTMIDYTFARTDTPLEFQHLTSQDVKLGMRFNFGTYDVPPPPPLRSRG